MRFYFPFDLGNTGNKREHLVTITGNSSQTFHRILPSGRDLESWWKASCLRSFLLPGGFGLLSAEIAAVTTIPGRVSLPGSYADGVSERFFR